MHLTRMRLGGVPPFTESVEFMFDERVNVFVGPNASGKSTVLSEISLAFDRDSLQSPTITMRNYGDGMGPAHIWSDEDLEIDSEYVARKGFNFISTDEFPFTSPVIYLGPIRIGLSMDAIGWPDSEEHGLAEELLSDEFSGENARKAFDQAHMEVRRMFADERQQRESGVDDVQHRAWKFFSVDDLAYGCAKSICHEIITRDRPRNYVTGLDVETLESQPLANFEQVSIRRSLGVSTVDVPNFSNIKPEYRPAHSGEAGSEPLDASFLSSGTQITLLWIWWLALKMLYHYDFAEDWHERPAILLIDEIENHLHPTWQRRVIPALLEHFPGLQIFATTHSPFVVAGLKAGQVHMLKRDADGVVTASTNEQDIIGWTTDEILRTFMGVDEPTDQLTIDRAQRLRELRGKESLTDEEAAEMEGLRRQVNEDFLSSSTPLEAQRERYGDMMLKFLRSRQSELSQDGD